MPSFDIVSEVDLQEVRNGVDQAVRELRNRFDFRNVDAGFALVRELLAETLSDVPALEPLLRRFVVAMITLHEREPELHRVLFEEAPLPASLRRQLRRRENELATEVAALLEVHPEVRMRDPRLTAYVLVQSVDALIHNFILHPPEGIDAESLTGETVRMLCLHLTA